MRMYKKYAEKPTEFLSLTAYTREEFDNLLPDFRHTYYEWMSTHRLDGKPRGHRKYSDYANSPLPSIEEKLFFILTYLKTNNLQAVQGALFGMSQAKANLWIHCLHTVLNLTLDKLGKVPARQMDDMTFDEGEEALFRVEHAIGSVKRYRIVKDKIRNRKEDFCHAVMATCCGLHNFRLTFRPWHYGYHQLHLFVDI